MAEEKTYKAFIEIPQGSSVKYEVDEETGELTVDRFMFTSFVYPTNYGYIKNTMGEDGDPLDVLVIAQYAVAPGAVIRIKPIGLLQMEDEGGIDTKIIAVPTAKIDPVYGAYNDISDIPEITRKKIKHFFDHMKELEEGKWVKTGDFLSASDALASIEKALK